MVGRVSDPDLKRSKLVESESGEEQSGDERRRGVVVGRVSDPDLERSRALKS